MILEKLLGRLAVSHNTFCDVMFLLSLANVPLLLAKVYLFFYIYFRETINIFGCRL